MSHEEISYAYGHILIPRPLQRLLRNPKRRKQLCAFRYQLLLAHGPTQILADMMTIEEHCSKPLREVKVVFPGDVRNNMCYAWMYQTAAQYACPSALARKCLLCACFSNRVPNPADIGFPAGSVVYERNYVTNRILEDHGIRVHTIPCSELSRGRGGSC